MTHTQLRERFPRYWMQGTGNFAVVCTAGKRISLYGNLELAKDAKNFPCGRGCDRQHIGYKLEAPAAQQPSKFSRSWKGMVKDA